MGAITVRTVRLETLLDEYGLDGADVVKLDIEGAEIEVLQAALSRLAGIEYLLGELHSDLNGCSAGAFAELLPGHEVTTRPVGNGATGTSARSDFRAARVGPAAAHRAEPAGAGSDV